MKTEDPNALCCLLYVSTAIPEISKQDLLSILESSRRHNAEDDITGLLLYCRGHFIQVLEGSGRTIDQTYERICEDVRHTHVKLMMREPCDHRFFHDWAMGFSELPDAAPEHHPSLDALLRTNAEGSLKAVKKLFAIFQATLA